MKYTAIIKKGTKDDPIWMVHKTLTDYRSSEVIISEDDDNLPVFQPYPEYIEQKELDKFDCELVEVEVTFI